MCSVLDDYHFMKFGRAIAEAEAINEERAPIGAYFKHGTSMIPHF
jgi:hypothetical protein